MAGMKVEKLIRLSKSCIGDAEKRAVMGVLDREFLGMGAEVQQFEQDLTEFFGRPAVCVVNGTAALQLALHGCGIGPGDEVLVQSLTYVASFQAISATGAKPVACDIDPSTLTLDWRDAEKRLTENTKAVMPVHYSGGVGALEEIYAFAHKHGLRVIEDAAHAFGTTYKGKRIGGFGDIATFSFDGIKNITSGEGGCIVSNDDQVIAKAQEARLLGVKNDTAMRYRGQRSWEFDVNMQGWRYHMSNIMAAIGIEQLRRIEEIASSRRALARAYDKNFLDHPLIQPILHEYDDVLPHLYAVRVRGMKNRDHLRTRLQEKNIQTGIHYYPNHRLQFYLSPDASSLKNTDLVFSELLSLPLHPSLKCEDINYICNSLKDEIG
jgi:dTDP-4-amino-4,6-dideoxygalactose transaminase